MLCVTACCLPGTAAAATLNATPSTLADQFQAAQAGDTILLASGNYGTFRGDMKSGEVTLTPAVGATATMDLAFDPASNITIDGLKIHVAEIDGTRTKNITVRNSDFDGGQVVFRTGALVDSNILFDNNVHSNYNVCSGCYAARIQLAERNETHRNGITIQNSLFYGGNGDGIQNGGNGTRIIANEFRELHQGDASVAHTDSIQLYGSKNTLISGNYFHDVAIAIGAYDGADHETIEDNVVVMDGTDAFAMQFLSDVGSVIRHNTFADFSSSGRTRCAYNVRCGTVLLGHKDSDPRSVGTKLQDNILTGIGLDNTAPAHGLEDFNIILAGGGEGAHDTSTAPTYVGGSRPTTYGGFALAPGSAGKGSASDGLDRGARFPDEPAGPPPPPPLPPPSPTDPEMPVSADELKAALAEMSARFARASDRLARIHAVVHDSYLTYRDRVGRIDAILHEEEEE